ncbi:MAG: ABC transporter substrate-binding protein [Acidimicrobiaceae bacterium]|nr:ABC transporter substrate-binding protein [Acidimicrobiaceae bacterium]
MLITKRSHDKRTIKTLPTSTPRLAVLLTAVLLLCGFFVAGCGTTTVSEQDTVNDAPTSTTSTASTATASTATETETVPALPVTVTDETGAIVTVHSIERIIPLDGDVAEVVFALGLGDNVVATDLSATYPPEADALPEIGYQRALSAETVASFAPTVLLATDIAGPPEALDDMRRLGYPLIILPNESTPTGAGQKVRAVAAALGVPQRGAELAEALDAAIAEAIVPESAPEDRPRVVALYVRGPATQLVLGKSLNTNWLIKAAGGVDVSESLGVEDTAPISAEAILAAAPDVILVPQRGLDSVGGVEGLVKIGGLAQTPAGLKQQVFAYDDQLLLGNGPRTAQILEALRDDLSSVTPAQQATKTQPPPPDNEQGEQQ